MRKELILLLVLSCLQSSPGMAQEYGSADSGISPFQSGKYVLTNVATGKSDYLFVSPSGDVYLQGGAAVQPSVPPQCPQSKYGVVPGLLGRQTSAYPQYGAAGYAQPQQGYSAPPSGYPQPGAYSQPPAYSQQPAYGQVPQGYPSQASYAQPGSVSPVFGMPAQQGGYGR